jgi:uncharacterized protein YyaL (SSP411 family)
MFLTPDGETLWGGTYLPKVAGGAATGVKHEFYSLIFI